MGRFARIALLAGTVVVPGCERSLEVSPGRAEALSRSFSCDRLGSIPSGVRSVFMRHDMRSRERLDSPAMYLAAGELGTSEFLIQTIGPDAKISLYTARGTEATDAEAAILLEFAAVFSDCRPSPQIGG